MSTTGADDYISEASAGVGEPPLKSSDDIQGNILAGFNKDHQVFMFLSFGDARTRRQGRARANARAWLAELAGRIATTRQVSTFNDEFRRRRHEEGKDPLDMKALWVNVSLTSSGLLALDPDLAPSLEAYHAFREGPTGKRPDAGGVTTARHLGDTGPSDPRHWVIGGSRQTPVDALVTVAADDPRELDQEVNEQRKLADRCRLAVIWEAYGETLPGQLSSREHFGFRDGVSQPGVRGFTRGAACPRHDGRDEDADHPGSPIIEPGEFLLGRRREQDVRACHREGLEGRRRPDPPPWMGDGSFQVFRRLTQDVPAWWAQVIGNSRMLADKHVPVDPDELAAKALGRWRSGTPLALAPDRQQAATVPEAEYNHFDYNDDPDGLETPRFAHIRKVNPRDNEDFCDTHHRILRRGIPFGPRFDLWSGNAGDVSAERGLLFNAFMADIEDQFEFLQQRWANDPRFPTFVLDPAGDPGMADGPDPVIGVGPRRARCAFRQEGSMTPLNFRRFVHTTGAVYAFAPSIGTLRKLTDGEPLQGSQ